MRLARSACSRSRARTTPSPGEFPESSTGIRPPHLTAQPRQPEDSLVNAAFVLTTTPSSVVLLAVSLLFGVGQCIVGAALVLRGVRGGRLRRLGLYAAGVLGAWLVCSGVAELIVSGLTLVVGRWGELTPGALSQVRHAIDVALVVASGVLAATLLLYPLMRRLRFTRPHAGH
jgi:hypothetical protein